MRHLSPLSLLTLCTTAWAADAPPKKPVVPAEVPAQIRLLQPGVTLTLLAEHPDLVTPTGIDVDPQGRIWLVSSHTHFRPEAYEGPVHDEILQFDKDGKNRRVFYNKTDATMHLECGPDGWIYLAERDRILRVKDGDGDGTADLEENLATLDTIADYPHNGLSGMAWHPDGGLVFSLGENFGKDWTLTSKDNVKLTGRGEGGVFRCRPDGTQMRRIARGFWNPFGLLVRPNGEIFAVDNDPGSRPPCRLLNIVEGADYGYQWVYGSGPVHPFVAWNGELRGTLGMIHPSGEGPCALVELGGGVMVPSWSNHCVDYFPLTRQGASYQAKRIELLNGSDHFRPVCIAPGPDGSFYLTDWVFSSYPLHGRGRLWKLTVDRTKASWMKKAWDPMNDATTLAGNLRSGQAKMPLAKLQELVRGNDTFLADAALTAMARDLASSTPQALRDLPVQDRVWALVALRKIGVQEEKWVQALLDDTNPEIRFECLRWIADGVLTRFSPDVEKMLSLPDLDFRLFEAVLATWNTLRGQPGAGVTDVPVLLERLTDPATPDRLKSYALRLLPATHAKVTQPMLKEMLARGDAALSLEVVRTLSARRTKEAGALLAAIATDETQPVPLRLESISGLASTVEAAIAQTPLLIQLAAHDHPDLRHEALRSLRLLPMNDADQPPLRRVAALHPGSAAMVKAILDPSTLMTSRPALDDTTAWLKRMDAVPGKADPEAGRRLFFHPRLTQCANCHRHSGRGTVLGPDLTLVARQGDRLAVLRSILDPNREVAPQFFATQLKLSNGQDFTGILLRSSSTEVYRDLTGREQTFQKADILDRRESQTSLMPMGLPVMLTDEELRDLLAFLTAEGT